MTAQQPSLPNAAPARDEDDEINLLEIFDTLLAHRWLIAAVTALAVLIGAAYALLSTPIYRADLLIQVEDTKGDITGNLLGDASSFFDIKSPATAEMQLLRSRLVVEQAVKDLHLDMEVTPRYLPLIGRWLAKRATAPSTPGLFGMGGFVTGNESLQIAAFDVPRELEGETFRLRLTAHGYQLLGPHGDALGEAEFGQPLAFSTEEGAGRLIVARATGLPGAQFKLVRFATLEKTEEIQDKLSIGEQGKQSGIIAVAMESADPKQLAQLLERIGKLYVDQNVQRKAAEAEKTLGFLGEFLPELRKQLEESEAKFNTFRNKKGTFDLGEEGKLVLERSVALQTNLLELQQKRKELRALYTPEHFSIRTLDAQISGIQAQLEGFDQKIKSLPDLEQDLLRLTRDVKVNNELYVNLLNSAQRLRLVKEGKVGNVRVVDTAREPRTPVKPRRALVVALAAMLGLLAGIALALLRKSLHHGLQHPDQVEQETGLHVFATVPFSQAQAKQTQDIAKRVPGNHVLALTNPTEPAIESLRSLRTALQFAMLDAKNKVLLLSSATPGMGKSFTSVNLAVVLGANNKKVLLIDADMRKGYINQYFGLGRERGLSEVLSGSVKLQDALHRHVAPNLDLITTGILPPNAGELLATPASRALLEALAPNYDHIIIDTPPVLVASDTAVLAPVAGTVMLLARADITSAGELKEAVKRLRQTGVQVNGVIFNGLDLGKRRYGRLGQKYGSYNYTNYEY